MFLDKAPSKYPNLVAFLRESEAQEKQINRHEIETLWMFGGAVGGLLVSLVFAPILMWLHAMNLYPILMVVTGGIGLAVSNQVVQKQRRALNTPERLKKLEAFRTVGNMRQMLEHNRLHRDLSESTLSVLEETARYRGEIRSLLESTFWVQPEIPENYKRLRAQALEAADQAMLDAVCIYRAHVPENVQQRNFLDYVDEAVETFVFSKKKGQFTEPGFDGVYDIAHKLQLLSDELRKTTHEAELDMEVPRQSIPGGLVDSTMNELRHMRQAQEELRQDLRH